MKKWLSIGVCALLPVAAWAQSDPGFIFGQVPTAAQWNSYFDSKQDAITFGVGVLAALGQNVSGTGAICLASGSACAGGGAGAFSGLSSGTNTTAAMVVGAGASLAATSTGTIAATTVPAAGITNTPNRSVSGTITIVSGDAAGQVNETSGSASTINMPSNAVIGNGQSLLITNQGAGTATLTGGQTVNGFIGSVLYQGGFLSCLGNGTTCDGIGFPGYPGGTTTFLRADGTWATPAGGGNVSTSGSITTNGMSYWASATGLASTGAPTNGQLLVGSTGTTPALATLTAGNNVTITNGAGAITINSSGHHTASIGWVATVNPNNAGVIVFPDNSTLISAVGNVETATGSAATVSVKVAPSATACSGGTTVHSGSFDANGTAATNQTLTLTTTAITAGQRLCLQTTGTTAWTGGTGVGTLTVTYSTP